MQQQALPAWMSGSADSTPITSPPIRAGCTYGELVVVLPAEVGDQFLTLQIAKGVLQLHQLNEQVVLRVQARRVDRALEVERQPLLDPVHAGALRQI